MRLHATRTASPVSSIVSTRRRRALLSIVLAGGVVACAFASGSAAAQTTGEQAVTVRLIEQPSYREINAPDGTRTLVPDKPVLAPDRMLPASKEFSVVVPANGEPPSAQALLDVWPRRDQESCESPPRGVKQAQHYTLGMRLHGTAEARVFEATVPPLEVDTTFCLRVQRTSRFAQGLSAQNAEKQAAVFDAAAGDVLRYIETAGVLSAEKITEELRRRMQEALRRAYPGADVALRAAVESVMGDLLDTDKIEKYRAAAALAKRTGAAEDETAKAKARDELREKIDAATKSLKSIGEVHIRERASLSSRPGAGETPNAGNYAAVDAGVVLSFPTAADELRPWLLPYFGVNLYFTPVDRKIAVGDLVGNPFWQRFSVTLGVSLAQPSLPDRTTRGIVFDRYPILALGWRFTHFVRGTAGAALFEIADRNPTSSDFHLAAAPFVGASLDIDVIHLIRDGFPKL